MTISPKYHFRFSMDRMGKGHLMLWELMNGVQVNRSVWPARSGSITKDGVLVNCIEAKKWYLCKAPELPVKEEYEKMYIPGIPGFGWKWRLYDSVTGPGTHYLFHPDGGAGGSTGCVVFPMGNAVDLFTFGINHMLTSGDIIPVEVVYG